MVSDAASLVLFIVVAVIICLVFAFVIKRTLEGKGCSCGKKDRSCACCKEHCSFRRKDQESCTPQKTEK